MQRCSGWAGSRVRVKIRVRVSGAPTGQGLGFSLGLGQDLGPKASFSARVKEVVLFGAQRRGLATNIGMGWATANPN